MATKVFKVEGPDGKVHKIEGPADASEAEILEQANRLVKAEEDKKRSTPMGKIGAFGRGAIGGVLMNFDDEIGGTLNTILPTPGKPGIWSGDDFKTAQRQNIEAERRVNRTDERVNPLLRGTGQVAGAVGSVFIGAPVARAGAGVAARVAPKLAPRVAKTLARPVAGNAIIGGATGAISGAGAGEGDRRGQSAALGAGSGAVLGGVLGGAVNTFAPTVARYVQTLRGKNITPEALRQLRASLARDGMDVDSVAGRKALETELARYGVKPVSLADVGTATRARAGVALRTPSAAQAPGIAAVKARSAGTGARLEKDITDTVAPRTDVYALDDALVEQRAQTALPLREAALNKPQTVEDLKLLMQQPPSPGMVRVARGGAVGGKEPLWFAKDLDRAVEYASDRSGKIVKPLGVYEVPEAKITDPYDWAPDKLLDEWGEAGPADPPQAILDAVNERKALGMWQAEDLRLNDPSIAKSVGLFGEAGRPRIPDDVVLQNMARLPLAQSALVEARRLAAAERDLLNVQGLDSSHLPEFPVAGAPLDMRSLDYLKKHLDKQIDAGFRSTNAADKARAVEFKQLRDAIRTRMRSVDETSPGAGDGPYGQYLDTYADVSQMRGALEEGQKFTNKPPEIIAREQSANSTAGQELYRVGAARSLLDRIRGTKDTSSPANRILAAPEDRAQLEATGIDPAAAARLEQSAAQERELELLNRQLQGSDTDARAAARADAEGVSSSNIPVGVGHPLNWVGLAARKALGGVSLARNAKVNEQLLPRILEKDPEAIKKIVKELVDSGQTEMAKKVRRAAAARYGAGMWGNAVGGPIGIEEGEY